MVQTQLITKPSVGGSRDTNSSPEVLGDSIALLICSVVAFGQEVEGGQLIFAELLGRAWVAQNGFETHTPDL